MFWGKILLAGRTRHQPRSSCAAAVAAVVLFAPVAVHAAPGDTGTAAGEAEVVVVRPLQLSKARDLDFGRIASRPTAGTVTVNPATGNCTKTGAILHIGGCASAEFVGMGTRNQLVYIQVQNVTQLTGPGAPMNFSNLQLDGGADLGFSLFQIFGWSVYRINPTNGIFDFRVGGTLNVNANQAPGTYHGSFNVRIEYY